MGRDVKNKVDTKGINNVAQIKLATVVEDALIVQLDAGLINKRNFAKIAMIEDVQLQLISRVSVMGQMELQC